MHINKDFVITLDTMDDGKGYCRAIDLYINVYVDVLDEEVYCDDFTIFEIETNEEIPFNFFSKETQQEIEKKIDEYVYENSSNIMQDARESAADSLYDSWKDGEF